jgi:PTS system nitrogen regulatory IIA component
MVTLSEYLSEGLIAFPDVSTRDEALSALTEVLHAHGRLKDPAAFLTAITEREKIVSTGIGMGVAIPHAKISLCPNFFIAIGVLPKGVDWNALDGAPVRLIFMMGGPDDRQTEYLQILSTLTLAIRDEDRRKRLLTLKDPKEIIALFQGF